LQADLGVYAELLSLHPRALGQDPHELWVDHFLTRLCGHQHLRAVLQLLRQASLQLLLHFCFYLRLQPFDIPLIGRLARVNILNEWLARLDHFDVQVFFEFISD